MRVARHRAGIAERLFGGSYIFRRGRAALLELTSDPERLLNLSVRFSALCILISMVISQDFWFQDRRVMLPSPLFAWAAALPDISGFLYWAMLGLNAFLLIAPEYRRVGLATIPIFIYLVLQDQIRWQFYLYMHFFNLFIAALPPRKVKDVHLDPLRYMLIGVYFWAGLYKMNPYFVNVVFPWFVDAWFPFTNAAKFIGMFVPFLEAGVGVFLLLPKTRPLGQLLATAMLIVVVLSVGPTGKNDATFVWPANVYMDFLAILLFMDTKRTLWKPAHVTKTGALAGILLFILLPALGLNNTLGHHQSFKLFCCSFYPRLTGVDQRLVTFLPTGPDLRANLHVSTFPVFQSSQPILAGLQGLCRYLPHPEKITFDLVEDSVPFWSGQVEHRIYKDICKGAPRLESLEIVPSVKIPSR